MCSIDTHHGGPYLVHKAHDRHISMKLVLMSKGTWHHLAPYVLEAPDFPALKLFIPFGIIDVYIIPVASLSSLRLRKCLLPCHFPKRNQYGGASGNKTQVFTALDHVHNILLVPFYSAIILWLMTYMPADLVSSNDTLKRRIPIYKCLSMTSS